MENKDAERNAINQRELIDYCNKNPKCNLCKYQRECSIFCMTNGVVPYMAQNTKYYNSNVITTYFTTGGD